MTRPRSARVTRKVPQKALSAGESTLRPRVGYLVSQYLAPSHTFIRREVAALRELGWQVDTFSIRGSPDMDDGRIDEQDKFTFVALRQPLWAFAAAHLRWLFTRPRSYIAAMTIAARHRPPGIKSMLLAVAHFLEAGVLAREIQRRAIDHLHNHFANSAATVGLLAARLSGVGWSFTMHGISETDYPAGLMLGRKIEAADFVVCASWFMQAQGLRAVDSVHWRKLHVVRCGVDPKSLPSKVQSSPTAPVLVCVGRLSPEKGHAGLFRAMSVVDKSHGIEVRLVGEGPLRESLEQLAQELGIARRVHFLGSLPEAATLAEIARADLLVLPSLLEGLPVVLMEAMAIGVPVIAPRVAGIPELIDEGLNGLLFTPSNWDELAANITRLVDDPRLAQALASHAHRALAPEFEISRCAAELSELFASVAPLRAPHPSRRLSAHSHAPSFGLREGIIFSVIALSIAIAVAARNQHLSGRTPPIARGAVPGK